VAAVLTQKGIESYCPLCNVPQHGSERKKLVKEPLFSSHVFVFATQKEFAKIMKTDGIINLVYWLDQPAVIQEEEITAIKNFLAEHKETGLEKTRINRTEWIRIPQVPLLQNEVTKPGMSYKTGRVVLPSLGYALVAPGEKSSEERFGTVEKNCTVQRNGATSRA